jgi:pyruvate/2-oxoglutarate dehydrogenase complex dihydrolipoamide dehydrogenase (E3) component
MLIHSADLVEKIKLADIFGIKTNDKGDGLSIDFQKIITRVNETTDYDSRNAEDKTIEIKYDQLLISVGRGPNSDRLDVTKIGVQ